MCQEFFLRVQGLPVSNPSGILLLCFPCFLSLPISLFSTLSILGLLQCARNFTAFVGFQVQKFGPSMWGTLRTSYIALYIGCGSEKHFADPQGNAMWVLCVNSCHWTCHDRGILHVADSVQPVTSCDTTEAEV